MYIVYVISLFRLDMSMSIVQLISMVYVHEIYQQKIDKWQEFRTARNKAATKR